MWSLLNPWGGPSLARWSRCRTKNVSGSSFSSNCSFPQSVWGRALLPLNQPFSSAKAPTKGTILANLQNVLFLSGWTCSCSQMDLIIQVSVTREHFQTIYLGVIQPRPLNWTPRLDRVWIGAVKLFILFTTKMLILLNMNRAREHSERMEDLSR